MHQLLKALLVVSTVSWLSIGGTLVPAAAQTQPAAAEITPDTGISVEEAQQFAQALRQMRHIQDDARDRALEILQETDLSTTRFDAILQAQQPPYKPPAPAVTTEEQASFDTAFAQISQVRAETQQQLQQAIEGTGLGVERFNQIFAMVQQNAELRQEMERILRNLPA